MSSFPSAFPPDNRPPPAPSSSAIFVPCRPSANYFFSSASRPSFSSLPLLGSQKTTNSNSFPSIGSSLPPPGLIRGEIIHFTLFIFYSPKQWPTIHQKRRGGRTLLNLGKDSGAESRRGSLVSFRLLLCFAHFSGLFFISNLIPFFGGDS